MDMTVLKTSLPHKERVCVCWFGYLHDSKLLLHLNVCMCRMDTTLVNFSEMKWERGDITFLFIGEREHKHSFYVLDNKFRVYQKIRYQVVVLILTMMQ